MTKGNMNMPRREDGKDGGKSTGLGDINMHWRGLQGRFVWPTLPSDDRVRHREPVQKAVRGILAWPWYSDGE